MRREPAPPENILLPKSGKIRRSKVLNLTESREAILAQAAPHKSASGIIAAPSRDLLARCGSLRKEMRESFSREAHLFIMRCASLQHESGEFSAPNLPPVFHLFVCPLFVDKIHIRIFY